MPFFEIYGTPLLLGSAQLLAGNIVSFECTVNATSGHSAAIVLQISYSGETQSLSGSTSAISVQRQIVSQSDSVSDSTSSLNRLINLSSSLSAVTGSTSHIEVLRELSQTLNGISGSSADLSIAGQVAFACTLNAISGSVVSLSATRPISSTLSVVSTLPVTLGVLRYISSQIQAISDVLDSALTLIRGMSSQVVSLSTATTTILISRNFIASSLSVSGHTADLTIRGEGEVNLEGISQSKSGVIAVLTSSGFKQKPTWKVPGFDRRHYPTPPSRSLVSPSITRELEAERDV